MKLNKADITENRKAWESKGYSLPEFDTDVMKEKTLKAPQWIHFGEGNLFRAFQANMAQDMLNRGTLDRGIIAAEGWDYEIVEKVMLPHDNLSIFATLKSSGSIDKTVVGSLAASYCLDSENEKDYEALKKVFRSKSLEMASFTITEKAYAYTDSEGNVLPDIKADFSAGPEKPVSYMGKVSALLYERFNSGKLPLAMVSMDNCSHNGDKLAGIVKEFADQWVSNGLVPAEYKEYVNNPAQVSFPLTMIDKITPRPDASVEKILTDDGVEDMAPIVTTKHTYIAPFVNSEEVQYLVIEDVFPNGRPQLEDAGVIFTDRETVDKVEKMKVGTCLNPLHTCLAVYGCILGYKKISDEMENPVLTDMIKGIGYDEGLKVVVDPGVLNPKDFIDTVINVRFPNPFMPDTPQRIATDTSQKIPVRYGETIKSYMKSPDLDVKDLKLIPLVFAGWFRYLMGIDDEGNKFTLSPDPQLGYLEPFFKDIKLGDVTEMSALEPVLRNKQIFGVDLVEIGMAPLVMKYFNELNAGKGAIAKTLDKYVEGR